MQLNKSFVIDIEKAIDDIIALWKGCENSVGCKELYQNYLAAWKFLNGLQKRLEHNLFDTVEFGVYKDETIEWIVLEEEGDKALLLSWYGFEVLPYNEEYTDVPWEECTLRRWLNNDFISFAFEEAEQEEIISVLVPADRTPALGTNQGNSTTDKVFLLSINEVHKYLPDAKDRLCFPTFQMKNTGAYAYGVWPWWLRSSGSSRFHAAFVDNDGSLYYDGLSVNNSIPVVRPACWVKKWW